MDIETLVAERDIQRRLVMFARAMDERDWKTMESITAREMSADLGRGIIQGNKQVIEFIRSFLQRCGTTQHLLGNIVVEVDGDTASSLADVSDMHLGSGQGDCCYFRTLGTYRDQWRKIDGSWFMISRVKDNRATMGSMDVFNPGD